ncbi:MAG: O-antigen ligase family protein, partial [Myxococcota bacterium]|nr:O-antigen ligase family protein [Myxococcota bacterium]
MRALERPFVLAVLVVAVMLVTVPGSSTLDLPRLPLLALAGATGLWTVRVWDRVSLWLVCWPAALLLSLPGSPAPWLGGTELARVVALVGVILGVRELGDDAAHRLLRWVSLAVGVQVLVALFQLGGWQGLGLPASVVQTGQDSYRVHGTLGHRNLLAGQLAATVPLVALGVSRWAALGLAGIVLVTGSLGAVLGLGAAGACALLARLRGRARWVLAGVLAVGAVLGVGVALHTGASGRMPLWRVALDLGLQNPVRGVGVGQFGNAYVDGELARLRALEVWDAGGTAARYAHDAWIHVFAEAGVPGVLGFTMTWLMPLGWAWSRARGTDLDDPRWAGLFCVVVVLGHSLVSFPLQIAGTSVVAAVGMGLAIRVSPAPVRFSWCGRLVLPLLVLLPLRFSADRLGVAAALALQEDRPEQAVALAERALGQFPDEGAAAYRLGLAWWMLGER